MLVSAQASRRSGTRRCAGGTARKSAGVGVGVGAGAGVGVTALPVAGPCRAVGHAGGRALSRSRSRCRGPGHQDWRAQVALARKSSSVPGLLSETVQAWQAFSRNSKSCEMQVLETVEIAFFGCFVCPYQPRCIIVGLQKANRVSKFIVLGEQSFFLFMQILVVIDCIVF